MWLFLDYDGTLVPIRKAPELAVLSPGRRLVLERLSRQAFVGVVSGRSLADIRRQVAIPGLAYIGNHGFEISYGGRRWVHPGAREMAGALASVIRRLRRRTAGMVGVCIEHKGLTGSVHYRLLAARRVRELREIVLQAVGRRSRELIVTEGKKVFEIRPNVDWDKGRGVLELGRWLPPGKDPLRIYIGDDRTDEAAFKALGRSGVSILVGRGRPTRARFRLAGVGAVWTFLRALPAALASPGPAIRDKIKKMASSPGRRPVTARTRLAKRTRGASV